MIGYKAGDEQYQKIESEVPFGRTIYGWLYLNNYQLDALVNHDQMEKTYLAWETVRQECNPYFVKGTGFEGYFVGRCALPEAALDAILAINQRILDAIARLYRFQGNFRKRLMRTLVRETSDLASIELWSSYLGAELARLRAQILPIQDAQEFQRQTYRIISMLPPISYQKIDADLTQSYAIGSLPTPNYAKLNITSHMLKPSQQDAWLVAENIGEFGHPLVRRMLDHV